MSKSKQEVFNEVYEHFEAGNDKLPSKLAHEAEHHGIRVEAVKSTATALASEEDDCDDE